MPPAHVPICRSICPLRIRNVLQIRSSAWMAYLVRSLNKRIANGEEKDKSKSSATAEAIQP
jgi:hypothetical protein